MASGRGHGMLGPAPSGFAPPSAAANPNMPRGRYGHNNQPLGQSIVVPNSQMPTALRGGPQTSPMSAQRHAQLQRILNRFEVSIAEANDLVVLEDYEIVLILDDSGSMNASSKPPEQRSLMQASTTRWEELKETVALLVELACCFDKSGVDCFFLNRGLIDGVKQLSCRPGGCDPQSRQEPARPAALVSLPGPSQGQHATDRSPADGGAELCRRTAHLADDLHRWRAQWRRGPLRT